MTATLEQHLVEALAVATWGPLCVAFSGGPDSTALLHALGQLPQARSRGLRALHVDHGLNAQSAAWAEQCRLVCEGLAVPLEVTRVSVQTGKGHGLEAAARQARYDAFTVGLAAGEILVLAHHRDDQAETVLLKLLRGAGPEGLGGMRAWRPFSAGFLWRPLLDTSRETLRAYVDNAGLSYVDDPSNDDTRLARNHLRHEILPRLARHWPQAVDSIVHSATLSRAAADALQVQWLEAFDTLHDAGNGTIDAAGWLALHPALREPLLDFWLHARGLPAPTTAQRQQIERQYHARVGQQPCIRWPGAELHIWRGRLWSLAPLPSIDIDWRASWLGEPITLPDGGRLCLTDPDIRLAEPLELRLRHGGERIKPAGNPHTRELRDLFQQGMIPPWRRIGCPLIHAEKEMIAVGDRWISARGIALFQAAGALPQWTPPG